MSESFTIADAKLGCLPAYLDLFASGITELKKEVASMKSQLEAARAEVTYLKNELICYQDLTNSHVKTIDEQQREIGTLAVAIGGFADAFKEKLATTQIPQEWMDLIDGRIETLADEVATRCVSQAVSSVDIERTVKDAVECAMDEASGDLQETIDKALSEGAEEIVRQGLSAILG